MAETATRGIPDSNEERSRWQETLAQKIPQSPMAGSDALSETAVNNEPRKPSWTYRSCMRRAQNSGSAPCFLHRVVLPNRQLICFEWNAMSLRDPTSTLSSQALSTRLALTSTIFKIHDLQRRSFSSNSWDSHCMWMICLAMALLVKVADERLGAVSPETYARSCSSWSPEMARKVDMCWLKAIVPSLLREK